MLDELEPYLDEKEKELLSLNAFNAELTAEYNAKVELKNVLEKARAFFVVGVVGDTLHAVDALVRHVPIPGAGPSST